MIVNGKARHVAGYMKDFLFQPEQMRSPVSVLSGGERGRLMLARALAKESNVLVLDEPTNDLDLETLDLLQELLGDYTGTVILVSHDRDFLDRVVTSVLAPDGDGVWIEYAGGYSDMIAQRDGVTPKRAVSARSSTSAQRNGKPEQPKGPPATPDRGEAPQAKLKLSYKEKFALETIPNRIDELHVNIGKLEKKLAAPDLFSKDPSAFIKASEELESLKVELAELEDQWLDLEMKRELIEGSK